MSTPGVIDRTPPAQGVRLLYVGAAIVICLAGIYFVRDVVAPVFLAITLVLTIRPLVTWLNQHRCPRVLSAVTGLLVVYGVLVAIMLALTIAFSQLVAALPNYAEQFNNLYNQSLAQLASWGIRAEAITEYLRTFDFTTLLGTVTGLMGQVGWGASFVFSLFLFVAFVAVDMADTSERREKLARIRPNLAAALVDFAWRVRKYWIVNTVFGIAVALVNMSILAWLQIPLVLTWGILSFVTAYIPNVGFIIGMVPPALMALLARDLQTMLIMVGAYLVVNFIASMVIQPKVTGDAVGLNITTTFISLVFWAIIIGPLGAILAVPLTLFFKGILFDADPRTRWLSLFLGGDLDDDVLPGDTVPPLEAPPVQDDAGLQPEPEAEAAPSSTPDPDAALAATEPDAAGLPTEPDAEHEHERPPARSL